MKNAVVVLSLVILAAGSGHVLRAAQETPSETAAPEPAAPEPAVPEAPKVNEAPVIEHQAATCAEKGEPISLCANVADDDKIEKARIYFRKPGEKYYIFVEMAFVGLNYCGTLPAPTSVPIVEYYMEAIDNQYEKARTSTYKLEVKPTGSCDFPPIEKDEARRAAMKVYATDVNQGIRLPKGYDPTPVTFVPATTAKKR